MGMHLYVVGFKPPDAEYMKMLEIWEKCAEDGTEVPEEVDKFFGYEEPYEAGTKVDLESHEWEDDNNDTLWGLEIDVADIPEGVEVIRAYVSC